MLEIVLPTEAGAPLDLNEGGSLSMQEWLVRRGQTPGAIERFWRVVLVSALDEELDRPTRATASTFSGKRF